jgi:transposase
MVDAIVDIPAGPQRIKRPNFSVERRRQIVEETLKPGASAALIAREHEINANLLFKRRRHYLAGDFGTPSPPAGSTHVADRMPVGLTPQPILDTVASERDNTCGVFEITRGEVHVRLQASARPH